MPPVMRRGKGAGNRRKITAYNGNGLQRRHVVISDAGGRGARQSRSGAVWQSKRMLQRKDVRRIIPVLVAHAAITTLTWRDLRRRPAEQIRGSKRLWRVASAVNTVGTVAYLAVGRKRSRAD